MTADAGDGPVTGVPTTGQFGALAAALQEEFGPIDEVRQQDSVGPVVSAELIQQTFLLILMGSLGIMLWITFRFRDFRMGVTALVALLHDVIVVVGIFAILGTFIGLQVDALFVTAMLTVIGFSVHDTIVVFDRVRENRVRHAGEPFDAHRQPQHPADARPLHQHVADAWSSRCWRCSCSVARPSTPSCWRCSSASCRAPTRRSSSPSPLFVDWHLWDDRRRARSAAAGKTSPAKASPA